GEAVVQLYLQDVAASVVRPVKELKGFRKVMLQPGETQVVRFPIDSALMSFYNQALKRVAEPGAFNVQVGLDSRDVQQESFELLP
ncbi:MAG: beta-glucosidase, partial [Variovorax sp.]